MMGSINDPFPTVRMTVPNLAELLERLRDRTLRHAITIVHAESLEQGEWILANAAARLQRGGERIFGPESVSAAAAVEQSIRIGANIVLIGEIRRPDDANALRSGAALGLNVAATISKPERAQAQQLIDLLGPWNKVDLKLLSRQPPKR